MFAARSCHFSSAKGALQQANDRFWQVDHLQLSTTPPRSFPYNPNTVLDWDMTDFRVRITPPQAPNSLCFSNRNWSLRRPELGDKGLGDKGWA